MEILEYVFLIILLISAVFIVVAVLLQKSNEEGLSGSIAGGAETFYGKGWLYEDALDMLFGKAVEDAAKEAELEVVGTKSADVKEIGENGVELLVEVFVKPEIEIIDTPILSKENKKGGKKDGKAPSFSNCVFTFSFDCAIILTVKIFWRNYYG